ncbi:MULTISPECIES: TRAP transporter small permease [Paracoccus]|uniref:TRAP transporter small permease n=1 Tax=Paracoccus TaxID=265 RepID=UPI001A9642C7|nr:TRAP transporter small permease [Paracoccus fontiphilus]
MRQPARLAAERLISLTHNLAAILLAVATALVFWQVVTRFLIGHAAGWSEVAARAAVVWMVFMVAGAGFRLAAMIPLDFLRSVLPSGPKRIVMAVVTVLTVVFLLVLAWYGWQMTVRVANQKIAMLGLSMSWFYAAIPVGSILAIPGVLLGHFAPIDRPVEEAME